MNFLFLLVAFVNIAAGSSKRKDEEKDGRRFLSKHKPCPRKRLDYPNGKSRKLSRTVAETAGVFETVDLDDENVCKPRIQSHIQIAYPELPITITPSSSSKQRQQVNDCVASTSSASQRPYGQQEKEDVDRATTSSPTDMFLDENLALDFLGAEFPNTQKVVDVVFEGDDGVDAFNSLFLNLPAGSSQEVQVNDPLYLPESQEAPSGSHPESRANKADHVPNTQAVPQASTQNGQGADDRLNTQNYSLVEIRRLEISKFKEITSSLEKKEDDLLARIALLQSEVERVQNQKQHVIEETARLENSLQFLETWGNL